MLTELGYNVTVTADGDEAVSVFKEAMISGNPFDLAILDLTIPGGMGGVEALKNLLALQPSLQAVVSSGYSSESVLSNFREYGFAACLRKPFRIEELSQNTS